MAKNLIVLVDEYTVHQKLNDLVDPITGEKTGIVQGLGKTYLRGEVIPANVVSPNVIDALEDKDHPSHEYISKRVKPTTKDGELDLATRLGLPFEDYDKMSPDEIVAAMSVLPSSTVSSIKKYEEAHEGRQEVLAYNVGFGEHPDDRNKGNAGSEAGEPDTNKAVADITTREVSEDGAVVRGEGVTGTGDPNVKPGTKKAAGAATGNRRRRRATRAAAKSEDSSSSSS